MEKTNEEQDWLEARKKIVGASEISAVIRHTISKDELIEAMGEQSATSFLSETDFLTPYELYHLKKGTLESKPFSPVLSEFGHKMELYAERYLNNSFDDIIKAKCQPQEVLKSDLHKLAGYTPDVFCEFTADVFLKSRDIKKGDKAVVEVKTINYFTSKKDNVDENDLSFQYIIQNQYQTIQEYHKDKDYKWAIQVYITPIDSKHDNDFYKGKAVAYLDCLELPKAMEWLQAHYNINIKVYPVYNKTLKPLMLIALDRWDDILENNKEPLPSFVRDAELISKNFKIAMPEIISYCKVKYGVEDGCIPLNLLENRDSDLYDTVKIYHEKCSELSTLKKETEEEKAKFKDMLLKAKILGLDDDRFSLKACKSGKGVAIKCNFKTTEETLSGKIATNKY